ncbi:MAG: elongation factor Ts [Paracoccaceae bacterium]|jgi:elongation factor Ts
MLITAAMVKELRDISGAGMMDAKKALTENGGDIEAAIDWLRTKGLATAAKKSGRIAAEGLVAVKVVDGVGVAIEVNSETDFVAKNSDFQSMVEVFVSASLNADDLDALNNVEVSGKTINQILTDSIATVGENMSLRRMVKLSGPCVVSYTHNSVANGMGKIGVLVSLSAQNEAFGKQVAMHVAAANPASLGEADLSQEMVEREKSILTEQARESGKPEQVIEKMIQGRMKKFLAEVTLLGQSFVVNPDLTVAQAAKECGVEINGFVRLEVGEGLEKKQEDFAAEVAAQLKG